MLKTTLQQLNNPQQDSGNSNSTSAAAGAAAAVPSSAVAAAGAVPSSVDVSRQGSVLSAVSMEPSNALLAAVMQDSTESAAASPAGLAQPRVRMELSGSSSAMSGQASLLGEGGWWQHWPRLVGNAHLQLSLLADYQPCTMTVQWQQGTG